MYECQINTEPKKSKKYQLVVIGKFYNFILQIIVDYCVNFVAIKLLLNEFLRGF